MLASSFGSGGRFGGSGGGGDLYHRVESILRPGGRLVGRPGSSRRIRMMPGGLRAAEDLFGEFAALGEMEDNPRQPGKSATIPDVGWEASLRTISRSGRPTIDVRIRGIRIDKIKFEE